MNLLLFDVDGTIAESGQIIEQSMQHTMRSLINKGYHIGIVGGGKLDKILQQLGENNRIHHYFSECGCVYYRSQLLTSNLTNNQGLEHVYTKNIRDHELYPLINLLVKKALYFLSQVEYTITGNFIDLRNGIIYISLIGMSANVAERQYFIELDKTHEYRRKLLDILQAAADEMNILSKLNIYEGGSVGIAIYPKEYDKVQVLQYLQDKYKTIHYFGDKYGETGNDHHLINHPDVVGHCVDSPSDTLQILNSLL